MRDQPDFAVRQRIIDEYDNWVGHKLPEVNQFYFSMEYPQRLDTLRFLLKNWILRAVGDVDLFLELTEEVQKLRPMPDSPEVAAAKWLKAQFSELKEVTPEPNLLVIGLMAWGSYIDKMTNGLFKSWLSPNNLPAVKRPIIVHILTDDPERIEAAPSTQAIKALGVHFAYTTLPKELLLWQDKYWLIGVGASLHLSFARRHRAAFHHSFPDTLYADGFMKSLDDLSRIHRNILMTTHRSDEDLMYKSLQPYIGDDCINVPAPVLGALSLNHMHLTALFCKVNTSPGMDLVPMKYFLMWESEEKLFTASPHVNPVFLHADTIAKLKDRYYVSLDSEMDFVIRDGDFYIPQAEDGMVWAELTGRDEGGAADDQFLPIHQYPTIMWRAIMLHDTLKFFLKAGSVPVDRKLRTPTPLLKESYINAQHQMLNQLIIGADPFRNRPLKHKRWHDR